MSGHGTAPRKRPSQERSRLTVDAIVEAAAHVFEEHGYAKATTNRIADRAGVSIGSLYQYFPNKDAILVALTERHIEEGIAVVGPLLAELDGSKPLDQALRGLVEALASLHRRAPGLHRVLVEEAPRPPALRERFDTIFTAASVAVAQYLAVRPEVEVADIDRAARIVVQVVESLTHSLVIHPTTADPVDAYIDEAVLLLHRYLAAGDPS
jgi:AcrR family transcriptional regulator